MVQVLVGVVFCFPPPALGERVFDVHSCDGFTVVASEIELDIAVAVAAFHRVADAIGAIESPPRMLVAAAVRQCLEVAYEIENGCFQIGFLLALSELAYSLSALRSMACAASVVPNNNKVVSVLSSFLSIIFFLFDSDYFLLS